MLKRLISFLLALILVSAGISAALADTLRTGSRGSEVIRLQKALKELGLYSLNADGIYGRGTMRAVQEFQRKNGHRRNCTETPEARLLPPDRRPARKRPCRLFPARFVREPGEML